MSDDSDTFLVFEFGEIYYLDGWDGQKPVISSYFGSEILGRGHICKLWGLKQNATAG